MPFPSPRSGARGSHAVLEGGGERQNFVLDLDCGGSVLGEVFCLRHNDGDGFTLQIQFLWQRVGQVRNLWWDRTDLGAFL